MRRAICILILSLITIYAWSNNHQKSTIPSQDMQFIEQVELQVKDNDTFYLAHMHNIYVYPKLTFSNKQQERFYWKTVRDVKKTLPFAKLLTKEMVFADQQLAKIADQKKRKQWWKKYEKYLFKKYEKDFRKMTASQGQMLMKLMDRESDRTSYEIIKHYRGKASANFWQFIAKLFKNDLKEGYDAEDKDRIVERVINLVEAGQL
ncbi:MAG: DUF4294 domain-containing protein [Paludibacteraceae bacterium]|nr:DUF4294 domain-containing protein [Paludibacteraceae bacterium]